ncbi:hypothetical protein ACTFIY_004036 [Dictyostelium cf. discoideum]
MTNNDNINKESTNFENDVVTAYDNSIDAMSDGMKKIGNSLSSAAEVTKDKTIGMYHKTTHAVSDGYESLKSKTNELIHHSNDEDESQHKDGASKKVEEFKEKSNQVKDDIKKKGEELKEKSIDVKDEIKDKCEELVDDAKDAANKASNKMNDVKDNLSDKMNDVKSDVSDKYKDVKKETAPKLNQAANKIDQ